MNKELKDKLAIALLEGKEREIELLKNQLADYQELLLNKETL